MVDSTTYESEFYDASNSSSPPRILFSTNLDATWTRTSSYREEEVLIPEMAQADQDFFLGTWTKSDGLQFSITKKYVQLDSSQTYRFSFPGENTISFSWNDLNRDWGEIVFHRVDDNTIVETHGDIPGAHFRRTPPHPPRILYRELTTEQSESFHVNGFLILKRAVDIEFVKHAKRAIFADLGSSGIPPGLIGQYKAQTWVPNLRADDIRSQILIDVFRHSALVPAISSLVIDPSPYLGTPQVALVFPKLHGPRELGVGAHIDGIPTPTNGLQYGKIHGFTSLIGIALSEQREDFCGNLVVYPGHHDCLYLDL
jgi:hypothetical protein